MVTIRNSEKDSLVADINLMIANSFGRRFVGNADFSGEGGVSWFDCQKPTMVARKPSILDIGEKFVGRFETPDGSNLRVIPKYLSEAKKYAELYEERTGREVTITTDTYADRS